MSFSFPIVECSTFVFDYIYFLYIPSEQCWNCLLRQCHSTVSLKTWNGRLHCCCKSRFASVGIFWMQCSIKFDWHFLRLPTTPLATANSRYDGRQISGKSRSYFLDRTHYPGNPDCCSTSVIPAIYFDLTVLIESWQIPSEHSDSGQRKNVWPTRPIMNGM